MKFKLKANVEFEADDIDDAFISLSRHMLNMYLGDTEDSMFDIGYIDIRPEDLGDGDID